MHKPVSETIKQINIKLKGYYRYYGITDNTYSIREFYEIVVNALFKILNKRSQKNKMTYAEYHERIGKKIEKPKIYVDIIKMSLAM